MSRWKIFRKSGKKEVATTDMWLLRKLRATKPSEVVRVVKVKQARKKMPEDFITPHFRWSEFSPSGKSGIPTRYQPNVIALAKDLEELRKLIGPIRVTSGFRTLNHNASVGGASKSQHLYGRGADIVPLRVSVAKAAQEAEKVPAFKRGGVGTYKDHLHIDNRGYRARWTG